MKITSFKASFTLTSVFRIGSLNQFIIEYKLNRVYDVYKTVIRDVFLSGEELDVVHQFIYLGVNLDSILTLKSHIKKLSNIVKSN